MFRAQEGVGVRGSSGSGFSLSGCQSVGLTAYRVRGYQGTQGLEDRRRLGFRCKALAFERWFQGRGFQGLWVSRAVGGS